MVDAQEGELLHDNRDEKKRDVCDRHRLLFGRASPNGVKGFGARWFPRGRKRNRFGMEPFKTEIVRLIVLPRQKISYGLEISKISSIHFVLSIPVTAGILSDLENHV